jgi:hypothetical protein
MRAHLPHPHPRWPALTPNPRYAHRRRFFVNMSPGHSSGPGASRSRCRGSRGMPRTSGRPLRRSSCYHGYRHMRTLLPPGSLARSVLPPQAAARHRRWHPARGRRGYVPPQHMHALRSPLPWRLTSITTPNAYLQAREEAAPHPASSSACGVHTAGAKAKCVTSGTPDTPAAPHVILAIDVEVCTPVWANARLAVSRKLAWCTRFACLVARHQRLDSTAMAMRRARYLRAGRRRGIVPLHCSARHCPPTLFYGLEISHKARRQVEMAHGAKTVSSAGFVALRS